MILTCPDCATSYFVDDARIPPEGRVVKCSSCGNRWRAERETAAPGSTDRVADGPTAAAAPAPSPDPAPEIFAEAPAAAPAPDDIVAEPAPRPTTAEDVEIVAEPAPEPAPEPVLRRQTARSGPKARAKAEPARRRPGAVLAWTALAATVALAAGAVVFRDQIVRAAPGAAPVFAAIGLPVDRLGLTITDVRSVATLQGGRPVLSVTGAIRNTRKQMATVPPLRVSILDRQGRPVAVKIVRPLNAEAPPGATRYFAVAIPDPPAGSASLDIIFEPDAAPSATHAAAADPALDAQMAAEPIEAAPVVETREATDRG